MRKLEPRKSLNPFAKAERKRRKIRNVPTILQMEATECGAACLAMILASHGRYVPLEQLRIDCGISRDGSKASNLVKAGRLYGLQAKGYRMDLDDLKDCTLPAIVHWNFNHFVVVEGFSKTKAFLHDPACGKRTVSLEEFDQSFTGIILTFEKGPEFKPGGKKKSLLTGLSSRLRGSFSALAFIVLTGILLVVPTLIIPTFSRIFIDEVIVRGNDHFVWPLILGLAVTLVLRSLLFLLKQRSLLKLETKISLMSSATFFWHVLHLPHAFFTQRFAGDISSRVASNDRVASLLSRQLAGAILNVSMLFFYVLLMLRYDVTLTLVGISAVFLNVLLLQMIAKKRVDQNMLLLQERGKLMGTASAGLQIIETLKATGSESDFFSLWAGYQAKNLNSEQKIATSTQYLLSVPVLLSGLTHVTVLVLGTLRVLEGHLSMGMLIAFQSLMVSFLQPISEIMGLGRTLQEVDGDMKRLDDVLSHPAEYKEEGDTHNKAQLAGHLELKEVSFGYSTLEEPLVRNFSLTLKPSTRVALVGASGSGKSTIARLVTGLYTPWSGEILFDGKKRQDVPPSILHSSLAFVSQETSFFEGSIRDNLTLWDDTVSDWDLVRATKDACIHHDITLKEGDYSYLLKEGGQNFSGGQRQRLEIARALVKNPSILVLDEATSALDPKTEQLVDEHLRRRGCTCLIVAHRLSTIRDCDEILVLKNGKIIERGTHEELLALDGEYCRLLDIPQKKEEVRL